MTDSEKLDLLLEKVTVIESDVAELKRDMADIKPRICKLEEDVADVKPRVFDLGNDIRIVRLEIENEVKINIQRVAEAHLDLSRKLDEARKPNEELEILGIKVRNNESEIRKINNRLNKCAPA